MAKERKKLLFKFSFLLLSPLLLLLPQSSLHPFLQKKLNQLLLFPLPKNPYSSIAIKAPFLKARSNKFYLINLHQNSKIPLHSLVKKLGGLQKNFALNYKHRYSPIFNLLKPPSTPLPISQNSPAPLQLLNLFPLIDQISPPHTLNTPATHYDHRY